MGSARVASNVVGHECAGVDVLARGKHKAEVLLFLLQIHVDFMPSAWVVGVPHKLVDGQCIEELVGEENGKLKCLWNLAIFPCCDKPLPECAQWHRANALEFACLKGLLGMLFSGAQSGTRTSQQNGHSCWRATECCHYLYIFCYLFLTCNLWSTLRMSTINAPEPGPSSTSCHGPVQLDMCSSFRIHAPT